MGEVGEFAASDEDGWRAKAADIEAIALGASRRSVRHPGAAPDARRLGDPRFRARRRRRQGGDAQRRAACRIRAPLRRLLRGARARSERAPRLPAGAHARRRRRDLRRPLRLRPGAGASGRAPAGRGRAPPALHAPRRAAHPPRGRRRRRFRRLGPPRGARLGGRRLQPLGRTPHADAQAPRQRPVGGVRPGPRRRRGLQIRDSRRGRRPGCRSRPTRSATRPR